MSDINETPRKVRLLRNLRINEVSAVDRGAGEGVKIVLMKRDDEPPPDARSKGPLEKWERAQRRLIKARERGAALFKQYLAKSDKPADKTPPPVDPALTDHVDRRHGKGIEFDLADGTHMKFRNERALAEWLAIQSRIKKSEKELPMTHTSETWQTLAKDFGIVAVAKHIVENGAGSLNEHEFTALVTSHAQREHPDITPEQAFVKVFTAQTEEGKLLRKAHAVTKDLMSLEPVFVGGSDARDVDGAQKAYSQLMNMAEEQRARAPWKTVAQLFSELMQDPKNVELAAKAHQRPTATTTYPFPK